MRTQGKYIMGLLSGLVLGGAVTYVSCELLSSSRSLVEEIDFGVSALRIKIDLLNDASVLDQESYEAEILKYIYLDVDFLRIKKEQLEENFLIGEDAKIHYQKIIDPYLKYGNRKDG